MGCWNGVCALTGLPVFVNNPVYVFMLIEQPIHLQKMMSSANRYWSPLMYHFKGEYNDYGGINKANGPMLDTVVEGIRNNLYELRDNGITAKTFCVKTMFKAERDEELMIVPAWKGHTATDTPTKTQRVKHIIVHQYAMDKLLSEFKLQHFRHGTYGYPELKQLGHKIVDDLFEARIDVSDVEGLKYDQMTAEQRSRWMQSIVGVDVRNNDKYSMLTGVEHVHPFPDIFVWTNDLTNAVKYDNRELATNIVEHVALIRAVSDYMTYSYKLWMPVAGSGLQEDRTYPQEFMAKLTLELADKLSHRWDEEGFE